MIEKVRPIVLLDRDGTINVDSGYVSRPEDVELIDGAAQGLAMLKRAGFILVVVSNQSAIGRGMATEEDVVQTNREIQRQLVLGDQDANLDLILFAPDAPEQASERRKPGIGMLDDLRAKFQFEIETAWMIGDKQSDLSFAFNAGIAPERVLLVLTGEGQGVWERMSDAERMEQQSFKNLLLAAEYIIGQAQV